MLTFQISTEVRGIFSSTSHLNHVTRYQQDLNGISQEQFHTIISQLEADRLGYIG